MSVLEIRDLVAGYGEVQILWGPSLSLEEKKLTCLVGGNGVGKTTMLRTVMGLIRPWKGSIRFNGKDITATSCPRQSRSGPGAGTGRATVVHRYDR
jgi:ABC-type branched-subunit amino acid transport system ATPase component